MATPRTLVWQTVCPARNVPKIKPHWRKCSLLSLRNIKLCKVGRFILQMMINLLLLICFFCPSIALSTLKSSRTLTSHLHWWFSLFTRTKTSRTPWFRLFPHYWPEFQYRAFLLFRSFPWTFFNLQIRSNQTEWWWFFLKRVKVYDIFVGLEQFGWVFIDFWRWDRGQIRVWLRFQRIRGQCHRWHQWLRPSINWSHWAECIFEVYHSRG